MFMFLVNDDDRVEVDGESLGRGLMVWNSEVGAKTLGFQRFMYRYICGNHMVWGAQDVVMRKRRHRGGSVYEMLEDIPEFVAYCNDASVRQEDTEIVRAAIRAGFASSIDGATERLRTSGFTKKFSERAMKEAQIDPGQADPLSYWGVVQGITAAAKDEKFVGNRVTIEAEAGKLLASIS